MFHAYTAAPRRTLERSHQPHRKTSESAETNPHQQSPKYTQYIPKTGTHGNKHPTSTSAYHHNTAMPTLDRNMQKQHTPIKAEGPNPPASCSPQLHSSSIRSPLSAVARPSGYEHSPAQSAQPPPGNLEAPKQT